MKEPPDSNRIRGIQKLTPIKRFGILVFVGGMAFYFKLLPLHTQNQEINNQ